MARKNNMGIKTAADYMDLGDVVGYGGEDIAKATNTTRQNAYYHRKKLGLTGRDAAARKERDEKILKAFADGMKISTLAERYNITYASVYNCVHRAEVGAGKTAVRQYRHLDDTGKPINAGEETSNPNVCAQQRD